MGGREENEEKTEKTWVSDNEGGVSQSVSIF